MFRLPAIILALSLVVAACERERPPEQPRFSEVLPNLPLPPQATFVSRAGGADAIQITVRSPVRAELVEAYYRRTFKEKGWRLVNDAKDAQGAVVLFVEQDGPPLWVRIRSAEDSTGTLVDIAGAKATKKPDSTRATHPPTARPNS